MSLPTASCPGEVEMRGWFDPDPLLPGLQEEVLGPDVTLGEALERIRGDSGLTP